MTYDSKGEATSAPNPASSVHWCSAEALLADINSLLLPCEVLLDVGCGIKPQRYVRPTIHICCEPFAEYVNHLQQDIAVLEQRDRTYVVLNMGWSDAVDHFPPNSVDTVFLIDVIEHLEKEEGKKLLALTEKIARKQVAIFTPLGFMPQYHPDGKDAWGLNGADWQEHKSGWVPEDFSEGWQIIAARDFHKTDNLSRPLEKPFGAMWAVKTYPTVDDGEVFNRERALMQIEAALRKKETALHEKEMEIHSLILARLERKVRRVLRAFFGKER
jgi:hypothetical protein